MNLTSLFPNFDFTGFPVDACTIPSPTEPGVLDGPADMFFLCVLVDSRFPDMFEVRQLRPYLAPNLPDCIEEGEPEILFGWSDNGMNVFDHHGMGIHDDSTRVVAWYQHNSYVPNFAEND